jgi:hypothetical protein
MKTHSKNIELARLATDAESEVPSMVRELESVESEDTETPNGNVTPRSQNLRKASLAAEIAPCYPLLDCERSQCADETISFEQAAIKDDAEAWRPRTGGVVRLKDALTRAAAKTKNLGCPAVCRS